MRKLWRQLAVCLLVAVFVWCGALVADRKKLNDELIRLHIVAASDGEEDQAVKLRIRDAVMESLGAAMADMADMEQAKAYLQENLTKIEKLANRVLAKAGMDDQAVATLCREAFDTRVYDTFTLPAGVYESLRITVGEGSGKNWWCVVFPTLCLPAAGEEITDVAAGAGFSDGLQGALTGEADCRVRFYFLDLLGQAENIFFRLK